MAEKPQPLPWTVHADEQITRRKFYHFVTDAADNIIFRARLWSDVVAFLDASDVAEYTLTTDEGAWAVSHRKEQPRED